MTNTKAPKDLVAGIFADLDARPQPDAPAPATFLDAADMQRLAPAPAPAPLPRQAPDLAAALEDAQGHELVARIHERKARLTA